MYSFANMWKTIKAYPDYEVSEFGEVRNKTERILRGLTHKLGYKSYFIKNGNYYKWQSAHRLVAQTYLPPSNKPEVNHIDGNKANNHVSNLEWVTHSENIQKSYATGQRKAPIGADHWRTGTEHTESTKKLMSDKKIGEKHPKFKGYYSYNNQLFASAREAQDITGIDKRNVNRWAKRAINGWTFVAK